MPSSCCAATPEPAAAPVAVKFHASLNVGDLPRAVAFYRLLFGCEPAKERADYAKFELAEPPLVLSLLPAPAVAGGSLNHFGLRVADAETLVATQRRLELGGVRTRREDGVECCYARQTKFWVADPDRVLWEIYVFHEDIDAHGDGHVPAHEDLSDPPAESPGGTRQTWQHRLGEALPAALPAADCSLHEVLLEGSANLSGDRLDPLLGEVFRALRPGGEVCLHGLTGDWPLTEPLPALPGPASAVEHVPAHAEVVRAFAAAGFVELRLEKLSATAHFTVGDVGLRELILRGRKPGHRPAARPHTAIYLGPLAEVADDFGNRFRRGEVVALNVHDWQALARGAAAEDFLLQ